MTYYFVCEIFLPKDLNCHFFYSKLQPPFYTATCHTPIFFLITFVYLHHFLSCETFDFLSAVCSRDLVYWNIDTVNKVFAQLWI